MKNQSLLLSILLLTLCSCAGQKIDTDRVKEVHKVAIVAIEIQQQKPTDNLGLGGFKELKDGRPGDSKELQTMARNVSDKFVTELQKKTGWKVTKIDELTGNLDYKKKVTNAMSGARTVMMTGQNTESIYPKNLLDVMAFRNMNMEERKQLAKSLGVDALAEVTIFNNIDQSWLAIGNITGDADFSFTGRANLQVYDMNSDDPIWRSQNVDGVQTPTSGTLPEKMTKLERLARLGEEASSSAIQKLLETYPL